MDRYQNDYDPRRADLSWSWQTTNRHRLEAIDWTSLDHRSRGETGLIKNTGYGASTFDFVFCKYMGSYPRALKETDQQLAAYMYAGFMWIRKVSSSPAAGSTSHDVACSTP